MVLISISALCMTFGTMSYLRYVHGWDARSALYGGSPGGMAQVISMAVHTNSDIRGVAIVQTVRLLSLYRGPGLPAGKKSLAFRVVMQDTERTLTDAEADAARDALVALLGRRFSARLRT